MKRYFVNEIFRSIQGEGMRTGTAAVFVRFSKCNLKCDMETMGWVCDTSFETGVPHSLGSLLDAIECHRGPGWVIFTGGEPALQLDQQLVDALHALGWKLAVETNGTKGLPKGLDWICLSPKYERPVVREADEVKYVLAAGQEPGERWLGKHGLVSPAFKGDEMDPDAVDWCVQWVIANPDWRLSLQTHKWIGVR